MSDIVGELARVNGAFEQPTLTILHRKHAALVIAVFRSSFARDLRAVTTARLHDQVDAYLSELRQGGVDDLPRLTGRELCERWMRGQWLVRSAEDDGTEVYSLTSHAQDALQLVQGLTRERASLSEHRISTIVTAVRRFNTDSNTDPAARIDILNTDIERLTRERDRLVAGGELAEVTDDYMLEGYTELLSLISALPSDFARVEESFGRLRSTILAAFRASDRPPGELVDDYIDRVDSLKSETPEGRAFEGAFGLLRDPALLLQLREDLSAVLDHPAADTILEPGDRRDLRGTVALVRAGVEQVLSQRNRVASALRDVILSHRDDTDRELDDVLRQIQSELDTWMRHSKSRDAVPLPLVPEKAEIGHLKERFYNPDNDIPAPTLRDVSADRPGAPTLDELRQQGGPSYDALQAAVQNARDTAGPGATLGELFSALPADKRRPVEIFGLLQLVAGPAADNDTYETFTAVRPDGSVRNFAVPVHTVGPSPTDTTTEETS